MFHGGRADHRDLPSIVTQQDSRPPPGESVTLPASPTSSLAYLEIGTRGSRATAHLHDVLPPKYDSVRTPSLEARGQAERNRQKQLIRDRAAGRQDGNPFASASSRPAPHYPQPPPSVEPSRWDGSERSLSPVHESPVRTTPANNGPSASLLATPGHRVPSRQSSSMSTSSGRASFVGDPSALPQGMSIQQALAQCHDPTLGWTLQFWVTVADPSTLETFFVCPSTGQTSWTPPDGVFILPRQAGGEWWELTDHSRDNRSYYYNTLSMMTQWTRPRDQALIIPLASIQTGRKTTRDV